MARGRSRRKAQPRNRGWVVSSGTMTIEFDDLDDTQRVVVDQLLSGVNLSQQQNVVREKSDFYLSRIILDVDCTVRPTALNLSGRIPCAFSLWVGDIGQVGDIFAAGGQYDPVLNYEVWLINTARMLRAESKYLYEYDQTNVNQALLGAANLWQWDLSYKGGLNVREGQELGFSIHWDEWMTQQAIDGDAIDVNWTARMLCTERRGT